MALGIIGVLLLFLGLNILTVIAHEAGHLLGFLIFTRRLPPLYLEKGLEIHVGRPYHYIKLKRWQRMVVFELGILFGFVVLILPVGIIEKVVFSFINLYCSKSDIKYVLKEWLNE